eukprot:m.30846 g.30846  ORF g.30846 m.30846 type:complete len:752 (+) comp6258_c0_seq2:63-2318(+)
MMRSKDVDDYETLLGTKNTTSLTTTTTTSTTSSQLTTMIDSREIDVERLKPTLPCCCGAFSTRVASDDFSWLEVLPIFFTLGVIAMAFLFGYAVHEHTCSQSTTLTTFAIMWVSTSCFALLVKFLLLSCSCQGTVSNNSSRVRFVPFLFHLDLCCEFLQLASLIYGAVMFKQAHCEDVNNDLTYDADTVVYVFVILGFCIVPFKLLWVAFLLRNLCFGCYSTPTNEEGYDSYGTLSNTMGNSHNNASFRPFLRFICGCLIHTNTNDRTQIWDELADVFMQVFGNRAYTYSDLLTGLELVHLRQKHLRIKNLSTYGNKPGSKWNIHDDITPVYDEKTLEDMNHFLKHAFSTFTWMMECYLYGASSLCRLCSTAKKTSCARGLSVSEDCCRMGRVSFLSQTQVPVEDVIYLDLDSKVYSPPFGVVIDREKKALVISIRGTFSVSDMVTDGLALVEQLDLPNGMKTPVHAGIHRSTKHILQTLKNERIFISAAAKLGQDVGSYEIITTGHSLGSAIASLLSIFLQFEDIAGFKQTRGFAFSAVPIVNEEVAEWANSFLNVFTLGHDMVGRLHLQSILRLKHEIDYALKYTSQKKISMCFAAHKACLCGIDSTISSPYWEREGFSAYMANQELPTPLYIPGRIIHVIKLSYAKPRCGIFKKREYGAFYAKRSHFEELILSGRMVWDHFPNPVHDGLESALNHLRNATSLEDDFPNDAPDTRLLIGTNGMAYTQKPSHQQKLTLDNPPCDIDIVIV